QPKMFANNLLGIVASLLIVSHLALGAEPTISASSNVVSWLNLVYFTCNSSQPITNETDLSFLYGEDRKVLFNKTYIGKCFGSFGNKFKVHYILISSIKRLES